MAPALLINSRHHPGHSRSQPFPTDDKTRTASPHDKIFILAAPSSLISFSSPLSSTFTGYHQSFSLDDTSNGSLQKEHVSRIVGGTIGAVMFLAISIVCVCLFLRLRRRKESTPETQVMGPLQVSFPMSKEAFTSPKYGHYGLSFYVTPSPSRESFTCFPQKPDKTRNMDSVST